MKGMLFSQMEPPPELETEFNDWYETEHIPVRLALPGFARAVRYREVDGERKYLAIYEIDDLAVLGSPGYHVVKTQPSERTARMLKAVKGFTRFTCEQVSDTGAQRERRPYLSAVAFALPPGQRARLDDWYESEHIPRLMRERDWLRVRRYTVISADGGPWTDFALYDLRSPDATRNPAHETAVRGPKPDGAVESSSQWLYEVVSVHERA